MTSKNKYIPETVSTVQDIDLSDTNCLLLQMLLKLSKIETHLSLMTEVDLETSEEEKM